MCSNVLITKDYQNCFKNIMLRVRYSSVCAKANKYILAVK